MNTRYFAADTRGHADHGWLDTNHTFSFASYYNPEMMGFGPLRVINDDRVAAGRGFGAHPHRDMEIISYVVEGALEHKDDMGTGSVIKPGDVQIMSAGTGVTHSEFNASKTDPVRFLQIWVQPQARGLKPRYDQKSFPLDQRRGALVQLLAPAGAGGDALPVHQDLSMWSGIFGPGQQARFELGPGRAAWVQIVRGKAQVAGHQMAEGDGLIVADAEGFELEGLDDAEVLVFDVAAQSA